MIEYKSLKELYEALIPAFNAKVRILKSRGVRDISRDDIWNYLKVSKWENAINLGIAEMVSDIMNVSEIDIKKYLDK